MYRSSKYYQQVGTMRSTSCSSPSHMMNKYGSMGMSMDVTEPDPPAARINNGKDRLKKSSSMVEFPTSPQNLFGEETVHFNHPQHPLSRINIPEVFTCAGCKEYGSGKRFSCRRCDFQLHDSCALAPPALKAHPFHIQHPLLFFPKPVKGGILKSKCDVCGKSTKGYNFRCASGCSYQIHPSCAMLSNHITISVHPHTLKLIPSSIDPLSGSTCRECNRKRYGRTYRCTVCDYHLHAVCAKDMMNGLQARGQDRPSMLSSAAKIASQVVMEFIGGLVEGIGEGVGQAFISGVARGHHATPHRCPPPPPFV